MTRTIKEIFDLSGKVAIITGGAGLLGRMHAEAIAEAGGIPVIGDIDAAAAAQVGEELARQYRVDAFGAGVDVTRRESIAWLLQLVLDRFERIDILINNGANNPKVE
ncbi:MAG: SDR family NAD(P)-dependent oxidoreductase, partial [Chloroflexi bacterium]|nr:SDR family NAD(P)-dependent oxidoreductase [Chloroflexota bacterium]